MAPPVSWSQSCGGAPRACRKRRARPRSNSSTTMAFSGRRAQSAAASVSGVIGPSPGGAERLQRLRRDRCPCGAELVGERRERGAEILAGAGEAEDLAVCGRQHARLFRIGEEGDRGFRADKDHVLQPGEEFQRDVDGVGHPVDGDPPGAALDARVRGLRQKPRPGRGGDASGVVEICGAQRPPGHEEGGGLAGAQDRGGAADRVGVDGLGHGESRRRRRAARRLAPGDVGRQDQGRDLPRGVTRGGDRVGGVRRHRGGARTHPHPVREGPCHRLDVGGQRRVIGMMVGGVVADDVDHRRVAAPGVVQIGEPVREPGPEMQQRRGGLVGHAGIAVGGAGHRALGEAEHAAHALDAVERRDEMHLRRAGIGEADVDAGSDERAHQGFGAVHRGCSCGRLRRPSAVTAPCRSWRD